MDELLVQYDRNRAATWVIQDAGGDFVALCDLGGSSGSPRVVAQWTYDAYGVVLSADHLAAHAYLHAGHKGLFFDRLDVGVVDPVSYAELPRHIPFAHQIYHNRNRTYNPQLGRFMQADPNAAAMTIVGSAAFNGRGMSALATTISMDRQCGGSMVS